MEYPPHDPFAGYLEVMSVIGILELKRALILGACPEEGNAAREVEGLKQGESSELLARLEGGIREAIELQAIYEEQMEDVLHSAADRADTLHLLFDSISKRMEQMQVWMASAVDALPDEDREEWDLLVSDYERIREQLGKKSEPEADDQDPL